MIEKAMTVLRGTTVSPPRYNKERKLRKWEIHWTDAHGRDRVRSYGTPEEARAVRSALVSTSKWAATTPLFETIGAEFVLSKQAGDGDLGRYCNHVLPWFEGTCVAEITDAQVQIFYAATFAKNLHSSTRARIFQVFRKCIELATRKGLLAGDRHWPKPRMASSETPCARSRRRHRARSIPPSIDDLDKLIASATGYLRLVMLIAIRCGLRIGEILALEWHDIDLELGIITVRASVRDKDRQGRKGSKAPKEQLNKSECDQNKRYRKSTKTVAGNRQLDIDQDMILELLNWRGSTWKTFDRVIFSGKIQLTQQTVYNHYRRMQAKLGMAETVHMVLGHKRTYRVVGGYTMHQLRHACAAIRIWKGEDPDQIARVLGHSNKTTTLDHYGYLIKQFNEGAHTWSMPRDVALVRPSYTGPSPVMAQFGDRSVRLI